MTACFQSELDLTYNYITDTIARLSYAAEDFTRHHYRRRCNSSGRGMAQTVCTILYETSG